MIAITHPKIMSLIHRTNDCPECEEKPSSKYYIFLNIFWLLLTISVSIRLFFNILICQTLFVPSSGTKCFDAGDNITVVVNKHVSCCKLHHCSSGIPFVSSRSRLRSKIAVITHYPVTSSAFIKPNLKVETCPLSDFHATSRQQTWHIGSCQSVESLSSSH